MKLLLEILVLATILFLLVGCTLSPESWASSPSSTAASPGPVTDEQILQQYPDGLEEAMQDLELVD